MKNEVLLKFAEVPLGSSGEEARRLVKEHESRFGDTNYFAVPGTTDNIVVKGDTPADDYIASRSREGLSRVVKEFKYNGILYRVYLASKSDIVIHADII